MSCQDHSLFVRAPNAFVAAWILLSTSKSDGFVFVTALPRYVELSIVVGRFHDSVNYFLPFNRISGHQG